MNGMRLPKLILAGAFAAWMPAQSVTAAPAQVPLYLGGLVEPNIVFTLDDSGSMQWEMMPDDLIYSYFVYPRAASVYGGVDYTSYVPDFDVNNNIYGIWARSPAINRIYYNPALRYIPWANSDGTLMAAADKTCAPHNPVNAGLGCRNLTVDNTQWTWWDRYDGTLANFPGGATTVGENRTFYPAFYYRFDGDINVVAETEDAANYTKIEIKAGNTYPKGPDRVDCLADSCTYLEEIQNFANWYTYYRSRILLSRAGVGRAFSEQGTSLRVGFAAINQGAQAVDGVNSPGAMIDGVRKFSGADRTDFFSTLYGHVIPTSGTPLRRAADDVGKYFSRTDNKGPWGNDPGVDDNTAHLSCRQSYNILMTDGYWNGADAPTAGVKGADDVDGPLIAGPDAKSYQYKPVNPYKGVSTDPTNGDVATTTLADVAMYYWNRDLRPLIDNHVPPSNEDPAFWQHLVTFTVGLGVNGLLDPETDLDLITKGDKSWPNPTEHGIDAGDPAKIDDLWHAAVNSRGEFFSAADPKEFAERLSTGLAALIGRNGSSASIATNSTRLDASTFVYQARFDSEDWKGHLLAFKVDENDGHIIDANPATPDVLDPTWEAANLLDNRGAARKIFTHEAADSDGDGDPGIEFTWASLPAAQKAFLNVGPAGVDALGQDRVEYLHGKRTKEVREPGGVFRNRDSILGDIVNSDPWYVGRQDYGYNLLPGAEGTSYITYRNGAGYKARPGVVYVGSNTGMLHAFHGETGEEMFAYVPEAVLPELWKLTDPAYSHRYYVDGPTRGGDAYLGGVWKSVLVGTTGAGGRAVFALDVTDPVNFAKGNVLWEFSSANDADLGYTIGQASIARMANGTWAAIFGNGYDSANHRAKLFIVNLATGALIKKIDTEVGDAANPNGLATPVAVDTNGDRITDRIYAGDLHGKMWAFDVSDDNNTNNWDVDYKANGNPAPLFTAVDSIGNPQPITAKPQAGKHPSGGLMVYFGTGKYFEPGDGALMDENAFYGIWDDYSANNAGPVSGKADLLQQVITHETITDVNGNSKLSDELGNLTDNPFDWDLRVSTENSIDWTIHKGWYMDLKSPVNGWEGERVVSTPLLLEERIVFSTLISSQDPCNFGGTSWLMEISSIDGARLPVTPFDLNNDGVFNSDDYIEIEVTDAQGNTVKKKVPVSGKRSKVGIIKTPAVIKTNTKEYKFTSGSSGEIEQTLESRSHRTGRQSWRQVR
ncbi:MAG: pilus assembly protein PilY [Gammaproteobacteria bacterium]|nr:pilus assembly protein PilY [Gammaproteobacteria bacterium]